MFSITDPDSGTAPRNARLFLLLLSSEHFRHLHNKFSGVFRNLQIYVFMLPFYPGIPRIKKKTR